MPTIAHPVQLCLAFDGKVCPYCNECKPASAYYRTAAACKTCCIARARRWDMEHPDKVKEQGRRWLANHPEATRSERRRLYNRRYHKEHRKQSTEYSRRWRVEHPEQWEAIMRRWRTRNPGRAEELARRWHADNREHLYDLRRARRAGQTPEQRREQYRRWKEKHPGAEAARQHHRRALKRKNGGRFTAAEWLDLCARCDHRCLCCGKQEPEISLTVDHVIPLSKGGSNDISNIQPLCMPCNSKKRARHVDYRTSLHNIS